MVFQKGRQISLAELHHEEDMVQLVKVIYLTLFIDHLFGHNNVN